jgi:TolA-binding protein
MMLEYTKKSAEAKKIYEEIKSRYPNTNEGREMDKYIARVDAAANS